MDLSHRIVSARKKKGLTQEQLADMTNITVRTVQRIESGESTPRSFTLKAIASALEISFEDLTATNNTDNTGPVTKIPTEEDSRHFLQVLCLSCFSYIVIPFIHFLVPRHILRKSNEQNPKVIAYARKVIRGQLYWKAAFWIIMLGTLAYNLIRASYFERTYLINYLLPFFVMYALNAILITINIIGSKRVDISATPSS